MAAFGKQLNEVDLAAVITYERNAWATTMATWSPRKTSSPTSRNNNRDRHECCDRYARPPCRRPPPRTGQGPDALGADDQPQGHRHPLPVVQLHDVPARRLDGHGDPRRAVPARPADRRAGVLQPDDHHARPDHGLRRGDAGLRRPGQLDDPADDRRAGHGPAADEQLQLLAAAGGLGLLVSTLFMPGGGPNSAGPSMRRCRPPSPRTA